jgi:hypothetical protein
MGLRAPAGFENLSSAGFGHGKPIVQSVGQEIVYLTWDTRMALIARPTK